MGIDSKSRNEYWHYYTRHVLVLSRLENLLKSLMENAGVEIVGVFGRIKEYDSLILKSIKKGYTNPFTETKDFSGVRIIYYRKSSLSSIIEAIKSSGLIILEEEDKRESRPASQSGYGAYHIDITFPMNWARGDLKIIRGLVSEIQIASVTEHLWANLSHKIDYKSKPLGSADRDELFALSLILNKFETSAEHLLNNAVVDSAPVRRMNSVELRSFLLAAFPNRERIIDEDIHSLLQNLLPYVSNVEELWSYWETWKNHFEIFESEVLESIGITDRWREDGAVKALLDLANDKHWLTFSPLMPSDERVVLEQWRLRMNQTVKS